MLDKLLEGVTDAIGFVVGALVGYGVGEQFGLQVFAEGYSGSALMGIALIGLGGGFGLQAARHLRGRLSVDPDAKD